MTRNENNRNQYSANLEKHFSNQSIDYYTAPSRVSDSPILSWHQDFGKYVKSVALDETPKALGHRNFINKSCRMTA